MDNQQNETTRGTKKCPKCQEEISSKAKRCPKCQADLRSWPAKHPILSILFIIIIFGIIHAILFGESKEDKIAKVVNAPVAERTTVDELVDTKRNNSVVFEAKYLHKKVEVSGYFGRIAGSGDNKYIELEGSQGKLTVGKPDCYPIIMDDFVHFKNGEPITVTGIIENGVLASEIKYCELKKVLIKIPEQGALPSAEIVPPPTLEQAVPAQVMVAPDPAPTQAEESVTNGSTAQQYGIQYVREITYKGKSTPSWIILKDSHDRYCAIVTSSKYPVLEYDHYCIPFSGKDEDLKDSFAGNRIAEIDFPDHKNCKNVELVSDNDYCNRFYKAFEEMAQKEHFFSVTDICRNDPDIDNEFWSHICEHLELEHDLD